MLHLYKRISTSDVGSFEQMVALNEASLVIGTAPGEWVTEPHRLRGGSRSKAFGWNLAGTPAEIGGGLCGVVHGRTQGGSVSGPP